MKILILGENSFVGKSLYAFLKDKEDCRLVSRKEIDFSDHHTFSNINFHHTVIVDCININNGNEQEIMACNDIGFRAFIDYLKANAQPMRYIYVSTISVLSEEAVRMSAYVRSKKTAEDHLLASGITHHIMRLSYPIGRGENKSRLISRLIESFKQGKPVAVKTVPVNLNAIEDVVKDMYAKMGKEGISFISNNIYKSLSEIALFLKEQLASTSTLQIEEINDDFRPLSETPFIPSKTPEATLSAML
jgi:dTDP-4-dehydrorhamnose reductase